MDKIMFNDKYCLTKAVIEGLKTNTRRLCKNQVNPSVEESRWKVGDVIAVAQKYSECNRAVCLVDSKGWSNKMFVSADLMPHRIKITNVRVERLQDICEDDCLKEGIIYSHARGDRDREDYGIGNGWWFTTPRKAFAALIDKVSGKGTWNSNPYVFVYDFELIR